MQACYPPGFYDRNKPVWQRLGQGGVSSHAQGLVRLKGERHVLGADAGLASWIFTEGEAGEGGSSTGALGMLGVLRGSFALGGTPAALLMCAGCASTLVIEQRQCQRDEIDSGDCVQASGEVRLGGMALVENVKCSWEFKSMQALKLETVEFSPLTRQDILEICYGGYSYPTCQNFTAAQPPPQCFYVRPPCRLTLYALSAHEAARQEPVAWAQMSPNVNRFLHPFACNPSMRPSPAVCLEGAGSTYSRFEFVSPS